MRLIRQYRRDTVYLTARVLFVIALLALLYGVFSFGANLLRSAVLEPSDLEHDQVLLNTLNARAPLQQQINQNFDILNKLRDKAMIEKEKLQLASLYDIQGQRDLTTGDFTSAEECFRNAADLDRKNPVFYSDLANLYARAAVMKAESPSRIELLRNSAQAYATVVGLESSLSKRSTTDLVRAASANLDLGKELLKDPSSRNEGYDWLKQAKSLAPGDSPIAREAQSLLAMKH